MIVLWGSPASSDFTWDLTYKFHSEIINTSAGYSEGYRKFSYPTRELSMTLGGSGSDAYGQLANTLCAGSTFVLAPMWMLHTRLTAGVSVGATSFKASTVSDLYANEYVMLFRPYDSVFEVKMVTAIAGTSVMVATAFANEYTPFYAPTSSTIYNPLTAYVLPCFSGIVEYDQIEFIGGAPGISFKLKVNGGVWSNATIPESVSNWTERPWDAKYMQPQIERIVYGEDNGILQLRAYPTTALSTFSGTWHFLNEDWKSMRELFFAVKGMYYPFYMPTGVGELTITKGSDASDTSIYFNSGMQYLVDRISKVRVYSRLENTSQLVTLTGYVSGNEFSCEPLAAEVNEGDRVYFAPLVRFAKDDLTFSFKGLKACEVKADFLEVLTQQYPEYAVYNPCSETWEIES